MTVFEYDHTHPMWLLSCSFRLTWSHSKAYIPDLFHCCSLYLWETPTPNPTDTVCRAGILYIMYTMALHFYN